MLVTTTSQIPGQAVKQVLGVVAGSSIRSAHAGKHLSASFKQMFGGQMNEYTAVMEQARQEAWNSLLANAKQMGANAIVGLRIINAPLAQNPPAIEFTYYGTAVKV